MSEEYQLCLRITYDILDVDQTQQTIINKENLIMIASTVKSRMCLTNLSLLRWTIEILEIIFSNCPQRISEVNCIGLLYNSFSIVQQCAKLGIGDKNSAFYSLEEILLCVLKMTNTMMKKSSADFRKNVVENTKENIIRSLTLITENMTPSDETLDVIIPVQYFYFESELELVDVSVDDFTLNGCFETVKSSINEALSNQSKNTFSTINLKDSLDMNVFKKSPPGALALECFVRYSRIHPINLLKYILDYSQKNEEDYSFTCLITSLVDVLIEYLNFNKHDKSRTPFMAIKFSEFSFYSLFNICLPVFLNDWRDMKATHKEMHNVMAVMKEQLIRSCENVYTFDTIKRLLNELKYSDIAKIWTAQEYALSETQNQARPVKELKTIITPQITSIIKSNRIAHLQKGTLFARNIKSRLKEKNIFIRLSKNKKILHYSSSNLSDVSYDKMVEKIYISNLKVLIIGKDCFPNESNKKIPSNAHLYITLIVDEEEGEISFIASSKKEHDFWVDGISILMNKNMETDSYNEDLKMLMDMEITVRLLEYTNIVIPDTTPQIPPFPSNIPK